ncbi:MAG: hypothetical protein LLG97_06455 [Deltaproteobacteria bacterium]|nr:hypothetical protein [Deltaproteobacteria bacterium]
MKKKKLLYQGRYWPDFAWCQHCGKAQLTAEVVKSHEHCTMPGCDGHGLEWDIMPWSAENWPRSEHSEYPEKPEVGKEYPLYS